MGFWFSRPAMKLRLKGWLVWLLGGRTLQWRPPFLLLWSSIGSDFGGVLHNQCLNHGNWAGKNLQAK
jgi:hypothetical protein